MLRTPQALSGRVRESRLFGRPLLLLLPASCKTHPNFSWKNLLTLNLVGLIHSQRGDPACPIGPVAIWWLGC